MKRKSMTATLNQQDETSQAPVQTLEPPAPRKKESPVKQKTHPRPDRAQKTMLGTHVPLPVKWELQDLATERSRALGRKVTHEQLLAEALNDLFKKYGKAEVAPTATGRKTRKEQIG